MTQYTPHIVSKLPITESSDLQEDNGAATVFWFRVLWNGKWVISAATLASILLTILYAYGFVQEKYTSTAVIILDTRMGSVVELPDVVRDLSSKAPAVTSEMEILRARNLMKRVVEKLSLAQDPEFNPALRRPDLKDLIRNRIETLFVNGAPAKKENSLAQPRDYGAVVSALLSRTTIRNIAKSHVIQITVETNDPSKSALIADTIVSTYIQTQLEVKFEATKHAITWLTGRVAELKLQLELSESRLANFSTDSTLVSAAALQLLERQLKHLRARIVDAKQAKTDLIDQLVRLQSAVGPAQKADAAQDFVLAQLLVERASDIGKSIEFDSRFLQILANTKLAIDRASAQTRALQTSQTIILNKLTLQRGIGLGYPILQKADIVPSQSV